MEMEVGRDLGVWRWDWKMKRVYWEFIRNWTSVRDGGKEGTYCGKRMRKERSTDYR